MNNNSNKPVILLAAAIAALFAISFVLRFVALSDMGRPNRSDEVAATAGDREPARQRSHVRRRIHH